MTKPEKPNPDFPLFSHASGKWAKKINGKLRYFGRWDDPDGALREFHEFIQSNPTDRLSVRPRLTILDACNDFLADKEVAVNAGELTDASWRSYLRTCKRVRDFFGRYTLVEGLDPSDFSRLRAELDAQYEISTVSLEVTKIRSLFKWCLDTRRIHEPVHFGPSFKRASNKAMRKHRRSKGKKLFTAAQVNMLLEDVGTQLRAMILLGINGGFGPGDCATLPLTAVDLESGWIHYPRPKTEVDRSMPLWGETEQALKRVASNRVSGDESDTFFVRHGSAWSAMLVSQQFASACKRCRLPGTFYWLRHTFETVAGGSKDQVAVNAIMGHVDGSMAAVYREEIGEERLRDVVEHVRGWLTQQR